MAAIKFGTSALKFGTSALAFAVAASSRTWQTAISFKPSFGQDQTNILLGNRAPIQDIRNGSNAVLYEPMHLEDQGHISRSGVIVSMPVDANISHMFLQATLNISAGGIGQAPSTYNGRTIVFKVVSGTLGAGNALGMLNAGAGSSTVIDSDPTSYRIEKVIADVDTWTGEFIPQVTFGGVTGESSRLDALAALSNLKLAMFFKDLEDDFDDIASNPYKAWTPAFRGALDHWDILRPMDLTGNMINCANSIMSVGQVSDATWGAFSEPFAHDSDVEATSHSRNQGAPIAAILDLFENGSPTAAPWTGWLNIPLWLNSPVRKTARSYTDASSGNRDYLDDGSTFTFDRSALVFWLDPDWVDLSSVTVSSGPTHGTVSVDTTSGRVVYNPASGGDPWTHTSGEQEDVITFACDQITWSAGSPSVGASTTFNVPIRVIEWNAGSGGVYLCRIKGSAMWTQNKAWLSAAARWQANAYAFVDALVAGGYSTTRPLYIEMGNETWNGAKRFEQDKGYATDCATAHTTEWSAWQSAGSEQGVEKSQGGTGIILAMFRKYVEDELATRELTYNLKWVVSVQTAVAGYSTAMAQGHRFAWEDLFSLTEEQADAKMADFYTAGTSYVDSAFADNAAQNMTGLSGSTHDDEILDRFDGTKEGYNADSSDLADDLIAWTTGATVKEYNHAWNIQQHNLHKTNVESEGGNWLGDYEGGDHDETGKISAGIRSSGRTNSGGQTFVQWYLAWKKGAGRATLVADIYDKRIANKSDDVLCQYGGLYNKSMGEPWGLDPFELSPTLELQKIREYGRLA